MTKDVEILAEYQIIERNGQAVTDLVRTDNKSWKHINQQA